MACSKRINLRETFRSHRGTLGHRTIPRCRGLKSVVSWQFFAPTKPTAYQSCVEQELLSILGRLACITPPTDVGPETFQYRLDDLPHAECDLRFGADIHRTWQAWIDG